MPVRKVKTWGVPEKVRLFVLLEEGKTLHEVAVILGRSYDSVRCQHMRLEARGFRDEHDIPREGEERSTGRSALDEWKLAEDKPGWREIVDYAAQGADLHNRMRPVSTTATRTITTKRGIFLVHMSDFHLGSPATDYEAFLQTTDLIMSDDRFFIVVVGPDLENAMVQFRDASAVLNQVLPPYMQMEAYRLWLEEMLPRCVAVCGDNHVTERLERLVGDIGLARPEGVPFFPAYGILKLRLDNSDGEPIEYEAVVAHKYKGSSIYHDLQPALRMMKDIYPLADWYVTAHRHKPAYLDGVFFPEARALKPVQRFIVCGTFKTGADLYAMRHFGGRGVLGLPTLYLSPDRHEITKFDSPAIALRAVG